MNIALRVARVSEPTGRILTDLLAQGGARMVTPELADGLVNYGVPYSGSKPSLNSKAGSFNNLEQIQKLRDLGIRVPPFVDDIERADWSRIEFPMLAREEKHHGGKDIKPVMQVEEVAWRKASGSKFFTQYVPIAEEFRVWVFRRRVQAVYGKHMQYPNKFRRIGRNWQNGFTFSFIEKDLRPPEVGLLAARAVFGLGLDFGAVDIIKGKDGLFYVLEVNSAPGVSEGIRQGISTLANSILKWANSGFKKQNETWKEE